MVYPPFNEERVKAANGGQGTSLNFTFCVVQQLKHFHSLAIVCVRLFNFYTLCLTPTENQVTPPLSNLYPTILSHTARCPKALLAQLFQESQLYKISQ